MPQKKKRIKKKLKDLLVTTSLMYGQEDIDYFDSIASKEERSRSWAARKVAREHKTWSKQVKGKAK